MQPKIIDYIFVYTNGYNVMLCAIKYYDIALRAT